MTRYSIPGLIAALLVVAACAGASPPATGGRIDASYTVAGGQWDDGATIYVLAGLQDDAGAAVICGAWTVQGSTANTKFFHDRVIAAGSISLDGQRIIAGLSRFNELTFSTDMTGQPSTCMATGLPWQPSYAGAALDIRLPRQTTGSVVTVPNRRALVFRQTPVERIIR